MKKLSSMIFIVFAFIGICSGQEIYQNKQFGFTMQKPEKWFMTENVKLLDDFQGVELTDENLQNILKRFQGALLVAFQKHDPKSNIALNPVIQINIRAKPTKDFMVFKSAMIKSADSFRNALEGGEITEEPKEVEISGVKSIFFGIRFTYIRNGVKLNVRSRTYAVPFKNYFFQINLNDGNIATTDTNEDCSKMFDEIIKSIRIGKIK